MSRMFKVGIVVWMLALTAVVGYSQFYSSEIDWDRQAGWKRKHPAFHEDSTVLPTHRTLVARQIVLVDDQNEIRALLETDNHGCPTLRMRPGAYDDPNNWKRELALGWKGGRAFVEIDNWQNNGNYGSRLELECVPGYPRAVLKKMTPRSDVEVSTVEYTSNKILAKHDWDVAWYVGD